MCYVAWPLVYVWLRRVFAPFATIDQLHIIDGGYSTLCLVLCSSASKIAPINIVGTIVKHLLLGFPTCACHTVSKLVNGVGGFGFCGAVQYVSKIVF